MKKRKFYERPAVQVIRLRQRMSLLAGSVDDRDDYDPTSENPFA